MEAMAVLDDENTGKAAVSHVYCKGWWEVERLAQFVLFFTKPGENSDTELGVSIRCWSWRRFLQREPLEGRQRPPGKARLPSACSSDC